MFSSTVINSISGNSSAAIPNKRLFKRERLFSSKSSQSLLHTNISPVFGFLYPQKISKSIRPKFSPHIMIIPGLSEPPVRTLRFFRNYPLLLLYPMYLNFASSNCLPHLPYIVRFIIFNLLLVPSTNPLL